MKKLLLCLFIICQATSLWADSDSLRIVSTKWSIVDYTKGVQLREARFFNLYGGPQCIRILVIQKDQAESHFIFEQLSSNTFHKSAQAKTITFQSDELHADRPQCFIKNEHHVLQHSNESKRENNGAIRINNHKLHIMPWSEAMEESSDLLKGAILSSGPMLLHWNKLQNLSMCDSSYVHTPQARNAVGVDNQGNVYIVSVEKDESTKTKGFSLIAMGQLMRLLGCQDALTLSPSLSAGIAKEGDTHCSTILYYMQDE